MSEKLMDLKEFLEKGYLQEVNRLFLHPLGLALAINAEKDKEGNISNYELEGIIDVRDNPQGYSFGLKDSDPERIERFKKKEKFIADEFLRFADKRKKLWRYACNIEPIEE